MSSHAPALLTTMFVAAACSSPDVAPPTQVFFPRHEPMALIEGPSVPPPENDIPESTRVAWFEAHRTAPPPPPSHVEKVVVREPVRYVYEHDHHGWDDWYLPISLSLGYWSGWGGHHGHDHGHDHGWGWGITYNSHWWH